MLAERHRHAELLCHLHFILIVYLIVLARQINVVLNIISHSVVFCYRVRFNGFSKILSILH